MDIHVTQPASTWRNQFATSIVKDMLKEVRGHSLKQAEAVHRRQSPIVALVAFLFLLSPPARGSGSILSAGVWNPSPRAASPFTGQADDSLEGIKANQSQEERIGLLKRFIVGNRGTKAELQGREMLMQEYALKGEQALKEGVPGRASVDFKSVLESAPAEITDSIFEKYIFPLPIAMNTFGYRLESVELMQAFEPRF